MKRFLTVVGVTVTVIWTIAVIALPMSAVLFFLNNL